MELPNFRLSTRITIAAVIIITAGAVALMFIENAHLRDVYLSRQRATLEQELHAGRQRLIQMIDTLRQDTLFLSNTPPVSGMVRAALNNGHDARYHYTYSAWEERLQQIFHAFSAAHPAYYQIRFIGVANGGRELARVSRRDGKIGITPSAELQRKGDRDYFKAALGLRAGEVYLSEFSLNQEWGVIERPYRPILRAVTPVFTMSGQIFGMVVINMDAAGLLESAILDLPPGTRAYVTNAEGQYLLHPDARRSFEFELGGKGGLVADFPSLSAIFDPRASEHLPLQAAATAARGSAGYLAAERVHFDSGNPARFLVLAHHLPVAVASEQAGRIPAGHISGGLAIMLLVSGIALLVLRRTFAPLEQITAAADKIAAGNYDVMLPQTGSGEIGSLANALGAMLAKLLQRERNILQANTELEARVGERTYELSTINELLHGEVLRGKRLQQETEALLRRNQALMQTSMDGIHVMDMRGNIVTANDAFCRMLGYTREEAVGLNVVDWDTQFSAEALRERFGEIIGKSALIETLHRRKDGALINVEISASGVEIEGQGFVFASSRDITARKQIAEAKLRESEERFRGTLEQAAVGIAHAAPDGCFQQVNQKFCKIVGYTRDELLRMSYQDITFPADLDENIRYIQQLLAGEISTFSLEKRYVRKDRSLVWVNLTVSLLRDIEGAPKYTIGVIEDITGRKRVEQQLRDLSAHLQTAREEEKASVAREIHDDLGGILTALKMDTYWLTRNLPAENEMAPLRERVESMSGLIVNAVGVTRRIITGLRPTILDDLGLLAALEWQAAQFHKRTGIECRVACAGDEGCEDELDKIQSINLFRIFQEALTNVARHSGASRVEVELQYDDEEISLSICDNGRGLPEGHTIAPSSYGIRGMCERAEQLGGRIKFDSKPGGGLSVIVRLPLTRTVKP